MRTRFGFITSVAAFAVLGFAAARPASAVIVNGSFETGDYTGFVNGPANGGVGNNVVTDAGTLGSGTFPIVEGTFFSLSSTGNQGTTGGPANPVAPGSAVATFVGATGASATTLNAATQGSAIQQTFFATAGDTITFDYKFFTNTPGDTTHNDFGFVVLDGVLTKLADTFTPSAASGTFPLFTNETATLFSSVGITTTGNHTISFGVVDVGDKLGASALAVDSLAGATGTGGGPGGGGGSSVPLPAGVLLAPLGALVAGACGKRMRRSVA